MKNSKLIVAVGGLIVITLTLLLYFLVFDSIITPTINWVSLIFISLSEILIIFKFLILNENIVSQSCIFTSVLYFLLTVCIFVIFAIFFSFAIKTYVFLNILVICLISLIDLVMLYFANKFTGEDKKLSLSQGTLRICQEKAQSLSILFDLSEYKNDLEEIVNLIKFSDNSELTEDENLIINKLCNLEVQLKANGENVKELIEEIKNAINLRSIKIKNLKRGGY